jgi:hypothetical protein
MSANDVQMRGIIGFLVGLAVMTVVVYLLMLLMFKVMDSRPDPADLKNPRSPLALKERERLPPEPRLQSAPGFAQKLESEAQPKESEAHAEKGHAKDQAESPKDRTFELEKLQEKWQQDLKDGPKDSSGKVIGIGIDQAMEQLVNENALPVRAITTATKAEEFGVDMPTAASSGRVTEKRKQ